MMLFNLFLLYPSVINYIIQSVRRGVISGDAIDMFKENGYDLEKIVSLYNYNLKSDMEYGDMSKLIELLILYAPILNYYGLILNIKNDEKINMNRYSDMNNYSSYDIKELERKKIIKKRVFRKEDNNE